MRWVIKSNPERQLVILPLITTPLIENLLGREWLNTFKPVNDDGDGNDVGFFHTEECTIFYMFISTLKDRS